MSDKPIYRPKIGRLDLRNDNIFKLAHFQLDLFNPWFKLVNPHGLISMPIYPHFFFNFLKNGINLGLKNDLIIKLKTF